jgi:hypothetical protein
MHGSSTQQLSIDTLCVAGSDASRVDGSAVMPIFQSATFLSTGAACPAYLLCMSSC